MTAQEWMGVFTLCGLVVIAFVFYKTKHIFKELMEEEQ